MKRVLVIGCGGSGKSTFAQRLAQKTRLPVIHLDTLYWKPGWTETPRAQWQQMIRQLTAEDAWIMDGNYGGSLDLRLAQCDTVILLDMPTLTCLSRVLKRRLGFHGRSRPDMAPGCPERLGVGFAWWILTYRRRRLPGILRKLAVAATDGKQVQLLQSASAVEDFLAQADRPSTDS